MGGYIGLATLVYMIVTIEQLVQRNPNVQEGLGQWTFGQTLGVIMLALQIVEIAEYLYRRESVGMQRRRNRDVERAGRV